MDANVLPLLSCPECKDESRSLDLNVEAMGQEQDDVDSGFIGCLSCGEVYPIISGIALLSPDWRALLRRHEPFLSSSVRSVSVPERVRQDFSFASSDSSISAIPTPDSDLFPYVVNHVVFAGLHDACPLEDLIVSPRLRALISEGKQRGPYTYVYDKAKTVPAGLYLDVGCGVGTSLSLALQAGVRTALGVDNSLPAVFVGRELLKTTALARGANGGDGRAEIFVGDAKRLPIKSGVWDLVSALNVLDELERIAQAVCELARLPAASGTLVIAAPFKFDSVAMLKSATSTASRGRFIQTHSATDLPWMIIRGPRYVEMLSIDLYEFRVVPGGQ